VSLPAANATTKGTAVYDRTSNPHALRRINVHRDYELLEWAKSLRTTPEQLREAVRAVGDRLDKVQAFLAARGHGKPS
jgi:hypothetical protein